MGKAAGIWKKIKKVGSKLWDGISLVNNKVIQPMKPLLSTILSIFDKTKISPLLLNTVSDAIDNINDGKDVINEVVNDGINFFMDTQNPDKRYKMANQSQPKNKIFNKAFDDEKLLNSGAVW